jgi:hypothetical protein
LVNCRLLVAELRATEEDGLAQSQAWVVMPIIALITQTGTISRLMQRIKDAAQSPSIAYSATMGTLAKDFHTAPSVRKKIADHCPLW